MGPTFQLIHFFAILEIDQITRKTDTIYELSPKEKVFISAIFFDNRLHNSHIYQFFAIAKRQKGHWVVHYKIIIFL